MRTFAHQSMFTNGNLALAIAPALTPQGIVTDPTFFKGFATEPQVLARGLLVLADITATRYFNYMPLVLRDPILSAQGDMLRAECFSACNGVYARLDLLKSGFDGKIGLGTTNVDIGIELRAALMHIKQKDKMHLNIGDIGLMVSHFEKPSQDSKITQVKNKVHERPVEMPDRWVRALGNSAEIHRGMKPVFSVNAIHAQAFIATLPPPTGKNQATWLVPSPKGIKLMARRSGKAAYVSGLHRLSALKRVMTNIKGMTFYMPDEPGASMIEVELTGMRITLSLTADAQHGYSGEGALLTALAKEDVLEDVEAISSMLSFEAALNEQKMAKLWGMDDGRMQTALTHLAVSGKLGFDVHENVYFHRELPDDPNRILKDNPRLVSARKLIEFIEKSGENQRTIRSKDVEYIVHLSSDKDIQKARCSCTWYLNHMNKRGPCKHILAVQLKEGL